MSIRLTIWKTGRLPFRINPAWSPKPWLWIRRHGRFSGVMTSCRNIWTSAAAQTTVFPSIRRCVRKMPKPVISAQSAILISGFITTPISMMLDRQQSFFQKRRYCSDLARDWREHAAMVPFMMKKPTGRPAAILQSRG